MNIMCKQDPKNSFYAPVYFTKFRYGSFNP